MATRTSSQSGPWSDSATWGGSAPPGSGDTAAIGHTVTVTASTTVGTSPNNNTTIVVDLSGTGRLTINSGVTLTIKGNAQDTFDSIVTLNAGSAIIFDNSDSGGSPVYKWTSGLGTWAINGTTGSHCAMSAISGQTFQFVGSTVYPTFTATYCDFTRMAASTWSAHGSTTAFTITNCTFTACGKVTINCDAVAVTVNISNNSFASSTGTENLALNFDGAVTSGTRTFSGNSLDQGITYTSIGFSVTNNYFGDNWSGGAASTTVANSGNFYVMDGQAGAGAGLRFNRTVLDNYFYESNEIGNPHFIAIYAESANQSVDGCIFEYDGPDAIDSGDCVFPYSSGGFIATIKNCIVLPSSRSGNVYSAGCLGTVYDLDADRDCQFLHNTVFNRNSVSGTAAINVAEASDGHANEVSAIKSNIFWSNSAATGLKASRIQGTTNGVITAAGADYNAGYNQADGDNGRGYNDFAGNLNLWDGSAATTGDAAEAGVDNNGITGDPQFVDSARNIAKWDLSLGGAGTSAAALVRLKADPVTNVPLVMAYVRAGFAPTNAAYRNAGHDGVTIGAQEYVAAGSRHRMNHLLLIPGR